MELLERVWESIGGLFTGATRVIERGVTSVFGSANARYIGKLMPQVAAINALEAKFQVLSDGELRSQTAHFRERLAQGETLDALLPEAFAAARESGRRHLGMRHYDVQLLGGMILHYGNIAEMMTGEGKTLVATLPAYLNALAGKGVHVVTVNDYLARRDMEWMGPLYMGLGLSVGAIQSGMNNPERQRSYLADITYGTNNEFGFDYLRDNMKLARRGDPQFPPEWQQVQGPLHYAIIDEVDNILIDEARTPLIISGPAHDDVTRYPKADRIARQLRRDAHFEVKEKEHACTLSDEGIREAERLAGVESFYTAGNTHWPHLIDNALKAHHLYKRDVNYLVENDEVIIVDEFTGRKMVGRQWSDGLHQAVEAKEGVRVKEETQTLATITLQNLFKLYGKISGMTGTALTEAQEFWKIYGLDVVAVPPNKPVQRIDSRDVIFRSEKEKYEAVADEIERINRWDTVELKDRNEVYGTLVREDDHEVVIESRGAKERKTFPKAQVAHVQRAGRPILVGTVSIEKSERLSNLLTRRGVKHEVLNAKHHQREAEIVAQAGRKGAVTIATNMAGRGTDIILGGNPEAMAWARLQTKYPTRLEVPQDEWNGLVREIEERENMKLEGRQVAGMGGLHVIGTERHEARRIDLQLRGRCGRQGDPGSSRFYLSLEDDLMRIFAGEWVKNVLTRMGMQDGEAIESGLVTRRIAGAQKKVEERNFDRRKHLLEYDEVMDEQRKRVYRYRQQILDGADCKQLVLDMIHAQIDDKVDQFLTKDYGVEAFCAEMGRIFTCPFEPRDFRDMDFESAERLARDEAERLAETAVYELLDENLPRDVEDLSEWNWEALARAANSRWNLNLRERDLKSAGRDGAEQLLLEKSRQFTHSVDCAEAARFLDKEFGLRSALAWAKTQFNLEIAPAEVAQVEADQVKEVLRRRALEQYEEKEIECPVLASLNRNSHTTGGQKRFDRERLAAEMAQRFAASIDMDDFRSRQRDEIKGLLTEFSRRDHDSGTALREAAERACEEWFANGREEALDAAGRERVAGWVRERVGRELPQGALAAGRREDVDRALAAAIDQRFRPEMALLERQVLLNLLDEQWKDHLLAMDHLKSSIGLVSYAQKDAKTEYKREGMQMFEAMWGALGERVTQLVFRIEQLPDDFVSSTWRESSARHDTAPSPADMAEQAGVNGAVRSDAPQGPVEPIRRHGMRVGRNDPCPCGSGKKHKNCCMRHGA